MHDSRPLLINAWCQSPFSSQFHVQSAPMPLGVPQPVGPE